MSAPASRAHEQNETAQLAAHFNQFYLDITHKDMTQIGNYRIVKEIGEGSFGKVYLAQHFLLGCDVVLKCGLIDDPSIVREIYYHQQLRHKNVVKLYEVIKTETHLWMVMEYCRGNELYYYIYEKRQLDNEVCQNLMYQIADAMRYVHSPNLAHRDLKLENILMADTRRRVIKLTDFGFVREYNPYKRHFLSTVCGTTAYMAPEVLKNEKYSGFAIDVWSMGVILYAMVYGELPFDCDDEMATKVKIVNEEPVYRDGVCPKANDLLRQMLSKDPAARPTIAEILNSPFLVDTTNSMQEKRPALAHADEESIISINQHYKTYALPFSSKIEKHLLKKMDKLGLDTEALQAAALSGKCNSLTAFYDLALAREFERKKKHHMYKKRYFDARGQLRRSGQRVRSALSLTDVALAAIRDTTHNSLARLDLASVRRILIKRSSEPVRASSVSNDTADVTQATSNSANATPHASRPPNNRTVSFQTSEYRSATSTATADTQQSGGIKNILGRMAFWKRQRTGRGENASRLSLSLSRHSSTSDSDGANPVDGSFKGTTDKLTPPREFLSKNGATFPADGRSASFSIRTPVISPSPLENGQMAKNMTQDSYARRQRPASMVSQVSQFSQTSQMYPMSESEFDIGTDMDDDYYEYESSINMSQQDLLGRSPAQSPPYMQKKKSRPAHLRPLFLDNLVISQSTEATRAKIDALLQIRTNSSEESSSRANERVSEDGSETGQPCTPPARKPARVHHPKFKGLRLPFGLAQAAKPPGFVANSRAGIFKLPYNTHMAAPMAMHPAGGPSRLQAPRSLSPPIEKSLGKLTINGTKPAVKTMGKGNGQGVPMFEINEEEEEDEE